MSRVLAVGDIHTKTWIIDRVEKLADKYDKIIFVGDYADDWGKEPLDTIETWRKLKDLYDKDTEKYAMVMGNHDFIYVNRTSSISGGYNHGTQLILNMPDFKQLKAWLAMRPIQLEFDDVVYSHAGIVEEWNGVNYWNDLSPIWVRPDEDATYIGKQVFGHTPSETCWEVKPGVWCIDTFSTYPDGTPFGDGTVLEIIDGKTFTKIKLEE